MFFGSRDAATPREVLNWRLWYGIFVFGLMGAARGLDEGLIGTTIAQNSFHRLFFFKEGDQALTKLQFADLESNIASMVQLGSIGGALVAFIITDKIGRLWAVRQLCVLWVAGIAIFLASATNGSIGMLYAGRFIAGLGIGQTTVVAPAYLAETSPRFMRGLCVGAFSGSVYVGIMLAYFASWACSIHISDTSQLQWVIPNLLHIYFAFIIAILSLLAIESPRWLAKVGKHDQALANLALIRGLDRNHWYVRSEMTDINDQLERQRDTTMGTKWFSPLRELVMLPANRYRLMLSIMSQLLSQWSGAQSITIYAPQYFAMLGTTGQHEKLLATAILGVVKFASALICALFLIDFVGRRRSLMTGIALQFVTMLYMAVFLVLNPNIATSKTHSPSQKHAATGAIVMIYLSGYAWAMGWNSLQYLINSEIYPVRLRALGSSIAMTFHFTNQYGNSKAVPSMFISLTPGGTMFFFSAVTLVGFVWAWFFLPELSGKSLEAIDRVFELSLYQIGRQGQGLTKEQGGAIDQYVLDEGHHTPELVEEIVYVDSDKRHRRSV